MNGIVPVRVRQFLEGVLVLDEVGYTECSLYVKQTRSFWKLGDINQDILGKCAAMSYPVYDGSFKNLQSWLYLLLLITDTLKTSSIIMLWLICMSIKGYLKLVPMSSDNRSRGIPRSYHHILILL